MSETLAELAATDALLTVLAEGHLAKVPTGDPVLDALAAWVDEIDSQPVPDFDFDFDGAEEDQTGTSRSFRIAATAVAITAMSSSGIAAAATGDPLAPFNYVATALGNLAPTARADQIRWGMPALDSNRQGIAPEQAAPDSTRALNHFWPVSVEGRHRADRNPFEPRHRASQTSTVTVPDEGSDSYTPRHVATDAPVDTTDEGSVPVETPPVDTPPVETPPVETPPTTDPPAETPPATTDPEPTQGDGSGGGSSASPGDNAQSGTGSTGGEVENIGDAPSNDTTPLVADGGAATPGDGAATDGA